MHWITVTVAALCFAGISASDVCANRKDDRYQMCATCVSLLQGQINLELKASLVYLNMAAHFQNNGVARKGFFRFFEDQSNEEKKHAHKLIHYINKRGARVGAFDVPMPENTTWNSAKDAVDEAVRLEKDLLKEIERIHTAAATACQDQDLMDFLENEFFEEQISSINALQKLLTNLQSFGGAYALGEYHVDRELLGEGRAYYEKEL